MLGRVADVAENLKRLREARGWTQDELERRSGVPQPRISKYEKGTKPDPMTMLKLAVGLGVSLDEIVVEMSEPYDRARDLSRHHSGEGSGLSTGGADDPASAREELERLRTQIRDVQDVARRLLQIVALDDAIAAEGDDAPKTSTEGGADHRAAR